MHLEHLKLEKKDGIGILTMNRPEKMNTWSTIMRNELREALPAIDADPDVRVLIFTGAGDRAFTAGLDLTEKSGGGAMPQEEIRRVNLDPNTSIPMYFYRFEKPIITAVNGVCVGAGISTLLAGDYTIVSDKARFRIAHRDLGAGILDSIGWFLPRAIGGHKAFELYATNRLMGAEEAERIGLVDRVVPQDRLMDETMELAEVFAAGPPLGLKWAKRSIKRSHTHNLEEYLEFERLVYMTTYYSEDSREARRAFLEKRPPRFEGR